MTTPGPIPCVLRSYLVHCELEVLFFFLSGGVVVGGRGRGGRGGKEGATTSIVTKIKYMRVQSPSDSNRRR